MDQDQSAIVRRVLGENKLHAEQVLVVLVQTLVGRHVDCQLEKLGRRLASHGGQPRVNALVAAMDALHDQRWLNTQTDPALADVQKRLFEMLTECQFVAEEKAGIGGDDDQDPPPGRMRIVTE